MSEITKQQAKNICGQIRMRKFDTALFRKKHGIELKAAHKVTLSEVAVKDFIGIYNRKASYMAIYDDWNDTL